MTTLADIKKEARSIRTRIWRCHDKKGLMKLRPRIDQLEELLRCRPRFRRSYGFEMFLEQLAMGRKKAVNHAGA